MVANIIGCHRRRGTITTVREPAAPVAPDRVDRQFVASEPDVLWSADITYVPTWMGFLYLAVVLDVFSRRIIGWAVADHLRTELVVSALDMALSNRQPDNGVIHHSDHGCQDTSIAFGQHCQEAGVQPSMGSVGDCYDKITESFFAALECELLDPGALWVSFRTYAEARTAIFEYIEGFYNTQRRHSALGYLPPAAFERQVGKAGGSMMDPSSSSQQGVWVCGGPSPRSRTLPPNRPSTYPCPTVVPKGGMLITSLRPMTTS